MIIPMYCMEQEKIGSQEGEVACNPPILHITFKPHPPAAESPRRIQRKESFTSDQLLSDSRPAAVFVLDGDLPQLQLSLYQSAKRFVEAGNKGGLGLDPLACAIVCYISAKNEKSDEFWTPDHFFWQLRFMKNKREAVSLKRHAFKAAELYLEIIHYLKGFSFDSLQDQQQLIRRWAKELALGSKDEVLCTLFKDFEPDTIVARQPSISE